MSDFDRRRTRDPSYRASRCRLAHLRCALARESRHLQFKVVGMSGFLSVSVLRRGRSSRRIRSVVNLSNSYARSRTRVFSPLLVALRSANATCESTGCARHINRPRAVRTTAGIYEAKFKSNSPRFLETSGRDSHNRSDVEMAFQRVPDCTQLEIGKERRLGGGVSVKPLARPRLAPGRESHLF